MRIIGRFVMTILIAAAFAATMSGCTQDDHARKVLEDQGYTQVEITGYAAFSCSDDDLYKTGFKALAPNTKRPVSGTVCEGAFKGATVRLD